MNCVTKFLYKLFFGNYAAKNRLNPAIQNQCLNLRRTWNNKKQKDFGVERLVRLFLIIVQFIFPSLYVRHISGKFGLISRKIAVETYVVIKLLLPIVFLYTGLAENLFIFLLTIYLLVETILYLSSLIFLADIYAEPISYKRSLLMLFINFIEIALEYAVIYTFLFANTEGLFSANVEIHSVFDIVYFSFVSLSTVGYGEITVLSSYGKIVVIFQIMTFLLYVGLFLNFFASKIHDPTYFNDQSKVKWNKNKKIPNKNIN